MSAEKRADRSALRARLYRITTVIDTPGGYARWPDRAADPRRVESVFRCFALPDHID